MPRSRRPYPPEYRERMIELVRSGRSPEALAREFDERTELQRLRRENATLREEREISKRAAAWLARETGSIPSTGSDA